MKQLVRANLVIGIDGSTTVNGGSKGLSSRSDRDRFHAMRKEFDVILIGGETARNEPYDRTPIPLVVISRSSTVPVMVADNPMLNLWNISPEVAIKKCQAEIGKKVLIEGGPNFLKAALPWIDEISITRANVSEGENQIDLDSLLKDFSLINETSIGAEKYQLFKRIN